MELTIELSLLTQQLRMRQMANEHHQRVTNQVRSQVWQPYKSMDHIQYGGRPYLNNQYFGWDHHPNTSWNTSHNTLQTPQVQRSSLEETIAEMAKLQNEMEDSRIQMANSVLEQNMAEMKRSQAESAMAQAKFSRSMGDVDYSQDGLPRFYVQNEMSEPPQEEMSNLGATMAELRRVIA